LVLRFLGPCPAEYCERYAKAEDMGNCPEEDSSDGDMSDGEHTSSDEEMAGHADP
jgi:ubiquitin-conjugating enzyme E2 H